MIEVETFTALSIGGNLGDRRRFIDETERELSLILTEVCASPLMETEPVGVEGEQPRYLNRIVAGYYRGDPYRLLAACLSIESALGRIREKPRAARTADVDILIFGDAVIDDSVLTVPHPELLNRRFCLEGLALICPSVTVPGRGGGLTVGELYKNMSDGTASQNVFFL